MLVVVERTVSVCVSQRLVSSRHCVCSILHGSAGTEPQATFANGIVEMIVLNTVGKKHPAPSPDVQSESDQAAERHEMNGFTDSLWLHRSSWNNSCEWWPKWRCVVA